MQIKIQSVLFLFSFFVSTVSLQSQSVPSAPPIEYSPYSRFGFGQPQLNGNAISQGLAGATTAFVNDSFPCVYINASNPASLASIYATALEFGAQSKSSTYYAPLSTNKASVTTFQYAALAMPIKKMGGLAFGISPEYQTGYTLTASEINNDEKFDYSYAGNGGLYKVFLGVGLKPLHKFQMKYRKRSNDLKFKNYEAYKRNLFLSGVLSQTALGLNGNYYFGSNTNTARNLTRFTDGTVSVSNKNLTNEYTGYSFNFGAITGFTIDSIKIKTDSLVRRKKLKQAINVSFGYNTYINSRINNKEKYFAYADFVIGSNFIRDTIASTSIALSNLTVPSFQKFGVNFKLGEKLNVSADYGTDKWKGQLFRGQQDVFKDQQSYAFGIQYTPAKRTLGKHTFAKRMTYRLGYRMNNGYLNINNTAIETRAIHAGLSIPLGRSRDFAFMHINGEYGIVGTKKNNLIQESYVKLVIGLSFNDIWFIKQRVD